MDECLRPIDKLLARASSDLDQTEARIRDAKQIIELLERELWEAKQSTAEGVESE